MFVPYIPYGYPHGGQNLLAALRLLHLNSEQDWLPAASWLRRADDWSR
jgi:hypothetical protein